MDEKQCFLVSFDIFNFYRGKIPNYDLTCCKNISMLYIYSTNVRFRILLLCWVQIDDFLFVLYGFIIGFPAGWKNAILEYFLQKDKLIFSNSGSIRQQYLGDTQQSQRQNFCAIQTTFFVITALVKSEVANARSETNFAL